VLAGTNIGDIITATATDSAGGTFRRLVLCEIESD
jgi:hypothetical protein